jgi:hypothetical protein
MARAIRPRLVSLLGVVGLALAAACGSTVDVAPAPGGGTSTDPGSQVGLEPAGEASAELAALQEDLAVCKGLDDGAFATKYAVPFAKDLGYDPLAAASLDLVDGSSFALGAADKAALQKNGFVISDAHRFPSFVYGYETIYAEDLPLYVSADSILFAVHRSYDRILESVEVASLMPDLSGLLTSMHAKLGAGGASELSAEVRADADLLVALALGLLQGAPVAPVAGADPALLQKLYDASMAASGTADVSLFGSARTIDFSQMKPRGHYQNSPELERYFRAMMWLGRTDLRLIETQQDGSQVFRRRQVEGAYALRDLVDASAEARWSRVHGAIGAFVGEPDSMVLPELGKLLADLGAAGPADLAALPDATIAQAIIDGGYGAQRIASQVIINGTPDGSTLPLSRSFALFGQRYVLDSHVFSNLVYSRVGGGGVMRMMPNPLDVGFAALHNDAAGALLSDEIGKYQYGPDLCSMRIVAEAHGDAFWNENLYNLWLSAIRALSPTSEVKDPKAAGLPAVAGTEPWSRRILSAQLASWAELRHDTLLYAKQSYTDGSACEFPDAYVDPYPELYARVGAFAEKGKALLASLDVPAGLASSIQAYFDELGAVSATLEAMAKSERAGTPLTPDQLAFINTAVKIENVCGSSYVSEGWYKRLFFDTTKAIEYDPTIADVHTQPTDEAGNPVGRVLHVGTGMARAMVVTVDTCAGPRAYVGLASSYFERITENYERLDDKTWASIVSDQAPPDPAWLDGIVVR